MTTNTEGAETMTYTDHDLIACVQHSRPVEEGDRRYRVLRAYGDSLSVWAQSQKEARAIEREYRVRIEGDFDPMASMGLVVSIEREEDAR